MDEWQEYARRLASLSPAEREAEIAKLTPEQRQALEQAQRIAAPPPPPPPPMAAAAAVPPPVAAPPPAKRKVWPWVLGCGCLLPLVVLAVLFSIGVKGMGGMDELKKRTEQTRAEREAKEAADRQAEEAADEKSRQEQRESARANAISAVDLVRHYEANEVAADQAFKGKQVAVRGTIDRVGKDVLDKMYVSLKGPDDSFRSVQCFFDDEDAADLASLAPGRRLLVQCRCEGVFGNVLLKKCQIIE